MPDFDIVKPFDAHLHLRRSPILDLALPETIKQFQSAVIMPNTAPRGIFIDTDIIEYKGQIEGKLPVGSLFKPIMVLYITPFTTPAQLEAAFHVGAKAGKLYPKGGTTNSEDGIEYYFPLFPIFKRMEELGMLLLIHGEIARYENPVRELVFLPILEEIATAFPTLKIVLEHVSTFESIEVVKRHQNVAGSITLHHMMLTETHLMGEKFHPNEFWKPTPKQERDRRPIEQLALSGDPQFFFGSDSAPHLIGAKYANECCAGGFSAPVLMPLLAERFERHNVPDKLENFVSRIGPAFYGITPDENQRLCLVESDWTVPERIGEGDTSIIPAWAGRQMSWQIAA